MAAATTSRENLSAALTTHLIIGLLRYGKKQISCLLGRFAHRAWNPPPSSSLAEEERLRSLLLRAPARDSRRSCPYFF